MPHYLIRASYTPAAMSAMIAKPQDREKAARPLIEAVGGKLHSLYFAMGKDDVFAIVEAPNDDAMAAAAMVVGGSGAFSAFSTTKLFSSAEAMNAMKVAKDKMSTYTPATG